MQQSDQQTQGLLGQEQKEMQGPTDAANSILAQPGPKAPQSEAQPSAPQMREQQAQNAHDFFFAAIVVAGIAGAISRSHATTALNAFGATLKGFREGQLQEAQQAYTEFKNASEAVKANNEAMQRDYQNALADRKSSLDEQMARLNMVAAKYHDPLMQQAASAKNYLMAGRLMQQQDDAANKYDLAAQKLIQQHDEMWAKAKLSAAIHGFKLSDDGNVAVDPDSPVTKGKASFTDAALDNAAVKYGTTGQISAGFLGADMRTRVQNRWGEMTQAMGMTPEQAAALPAEKKADAVALAMDTKWIDGVERSQEIVLGQIPIVQSYLDQLPLTEIQRVNGLILQGAREFGSPEAQAYGNAMSSLEMEWGRLSAGPQSIAMLPVEVMRIGANRFGNLTPNQFAAEADLLPKEEANSVQAQTKIIENRRKSLENLKTSSPAAAPSPGAGGNGGWSIQKVP